MGKRPSRHEVLRVAFDECKWGVLLIYGDRAMGLRTFEPLWREDVECIELASLNRWQLTNSQTIS
jgi:hypothetical protein